MNWQHLSNWPQENLWRGTVLRVLESQAPYEVPLDLILAESHSSPSGFAFIVTTGYYAGVVLRELPLTALADGQVRAISRRWLLENWQIEIYEACPTSALRIVEGYPPGVTSQSL